MGRSTVRVVVRMRPTDRFANSVLTVRDDQRSVDVITKTRGGLGSDGPSNVEGHAYKFDQVFTDASQETMYDACASDIVKSVVSGYNGTVMAYGQTGAGKTYTMNGGTDYRSRGVIPRAVKAVFDEAATQVEKQFEVRVSYVEVYNDRMTDLLAPNSDAEISIQEDAKGAITVRGASHTLCTHESEALACLFTGNTNRAVGEHSLNANSSRSHCVFTVHVTSRSRVESESASLLGKLHFVDLAGSERVGKTESAGTLLREAQFINKSLTFLEQVVMALGSANRHVPFRQSKLTNLLKDSLGGNSRTTMVANVWPEERHLEETVSTFKFASRMMRVTSEATVNTILDPETHIRQLNRKIGDLKAELQMQNQLVGKSHIAYEGDIGEDERFEMEKTVKAYVAGKVQDIDVRSLREVKEYFRIFKAFVDNKDLEAGGVQAPVPPDGKSAGMQQSFRAGAGRGGGAAAPGSAHDNKTGGTAPGEAGVGAIDPASGPSVGVAAPHKAIREVVRGPTALPTSPQQMGLNGTSVSGSPPRGDAMADDSDYPGSTTAGGVAPGGGAVAAAPPNKAAAFADYKLGDGAKLVAALREHQDQLQAKRKEASDLSLKVNETKAVIDVTAQQLEQRRVDRQARGEDEVVDNEEFDVVKRLKAKKAEYRQFYDELASAKTARDHLLRIVDHGKQQLLSSFEQWYDRSFIGANSSSTGPSTSIAAGAASWRGGAAARMRSGAGGRTVAGALGEDDDDRLDEGERFELLELNRVMDQDPDSVAFYQAKKQLQAKQTMSTVGVAPQPRTNRRASPARRR